MNLTTATTTVFSVPPEGEAVKAPTADVAAETVRQKTETFDSAILALDHAAIKQQAQRFVDMGFHIGIIPPERRCIVDDTGKNHWYHELGKRPLVSGWPVAALEDWVSPTDIPRNCNYFILCGTPFIRDGKTVGYVFDTDIDEGFAVPIFLRVYDAFGLPTAFKWGRPGKPNSHLLFLVDKPATGFSKLCHKIAEIRCQTKDGAYFPYGHQSVTFPSVWCKDGRVEVIRQEPDSAPEPPVVSCDLLIKAFRTAIGVSLLAPLMPSGSRHNPRMAFFRLAATGGMAEDDAVRFMTLVEHFQNRKSSSDIGAEAASIYKIVRDGFKSDNDTEIPLYGFPFLLSQIGESNEQVLRDLLELLEIDSSGNSTESKKTKTDQSLPPCFELHGDGLYHRSPPTKDRVKQGEEQTYSQLPSTWISDPIHIVAQTRTADGLEWGKQLTWTDKDGHDQEWTMPAGMLSGDGSPIREQLMTRGLMISPNRFAREHFLEYIIKSEPATKIRSVTQTGWHETCFVLPYETIGKTAEPIVLQTVAHANSETYSSKGTLLDWQRRISKPCIGNSRLVFAVSAAFAGPLLRLVNEQGAGFHAKGKTSIGKSTGLFAAASVWGSPRFRGTWRTTSNGLESTAALHNDSLLVLDEIDEAEAGDAGAMIYMLINGQGKQRMTRNATLRKPYVWRLIYLSSGESSLSDHMHTAGKKTKGGQEVRCLEIPADANKGFGAFEDLHGGTDPAAFSDEIQKACEEHYGVAGRQYIEKLCEDLERVKNKAAVDLAKFIKENRPEGASEEVGRACKKFGIVAVAGEIATELRITAWDSVPNEAWNSAITCFHGWMESRGGTGSSDIDNGIRQVRRFLEAHGTSRFEVIDTIETPYSPSGLIRDRVGFRERVADRQTVADGDEFVNIDTGYASWDYYFLPEQFREVCKGYDTIAVARAMADRGILIRDGNALQARRRFDGMGKQTRVYHVTSQIFEGTEL